MRVAEDEVVAGAVRLLLDRLCQLVGVIKGFVMSETTRAILRVDPVRRLRASDQRLVARLFDGGQDARVRVCGETVAVSLTSTETVCTDTLAQSGGTPSWSAAGLRWHPWRHGCASLHSGGLI